MRRGTNVFRKLHIGKGRAMQLLATAFLLVLCAAAVSLAWYVARLREAWSKERAVMDPYCLYLRDENDDELVELSVGGLSPGEVKEIPFCVSNAPNDTINMGGGEFDFNLELIHTENLPLTYGIYELEQQDSEKSSVYEDDTATRTEADGEDVTEERHTELFGDTDVKNVVNKGKYLLYETVGNGSETLHLSTGTDSSGSETYTTKYFILRITFPQVQNFQDYKKETDVIYLLATAKQPRPVSGGG